MHVAAVSVKTVRFFASVRFRCPGLPEYSPTTYPLQPVVEGLAFVRNANEA